MSEYRQTASDIYNWLASLQESKTGYNHGGIHDPLDGRVMGEHYSTSFFALLSSLLYQQDKDPDKLRRAKNAIAFHIRTSKDEYKEGAWAYHWDFNNYALVSTFRILKKELSNSEKDRWRYAMRVWKSNKHKAINWILMRAYNAYSRYDELGSFLDLFNYYRYCRCALNSQLSDGCIDDERGNSRPIQYHAYCTALLYKIYVLTSNQNVLSSFIKALGFLSHFVDPGGAFNYLGRGQEQIFGYAVAIYSFEAGKILCPEDAGLLEDLASRCWSYLKTYQTEQGFFPLVLNDKNNNRRYGWYDYHHITVYNAFLGVWLAEISFLVGGDTPCRVVPKNIIKKDRITFNISSGTLIHNSDKYFVCFSRGQNSRYLADCGLVIQHLYISGYGDLISCPGGAGGPNDKLFAQKHACTSELIKNFSAPLFRKDDHWLVPAWRGGILEKENELVYSLRYSYFDGISVHRKVLFGDNSLILDDSIEISPGVVPQQIRLINLPLIVRGNLKKISGHELLVQSKVNILIQIQTKAPCIVNRERLRTAKGDIENYYWLLDSDQLQPVGNFHVLTRFMFIEDLSYLSR